MFPDNPPLNDNSRRIEGDVSGNQGQIIFGDAYISRDIILTEKTDEIIQRSARLVPPSQLTPIIELLTANRFVVLTSPLYWNQEYLGEYLATYLKENQHGKHIYTLNVAVSGKKLLEALLEDTNTYREMIVLAPSIDPTKYKQDIIPQLKRIAHERNIYFIFMTHHAETDWTPLGQKPVNLEKQSPYTLADLINIMERYLEDIILPYSLAVELDDLSKNPVIPGLRQPISEIVQELGSPGIIERFVQHIEYLTEPDISKETVALESELQRIYDATLTEKSTEIETSIEAWFKGLPEPARFLVLAVSLVNDLPQETFWAIYEKLTVFAWRERNQQLTMSDYVDIDYQLNRYIDTTQDEIGFKNDDYRNYLVTYALKSYRRSLVQALPILADIVSGVAEQRSGGGRSKLSEAGQLRNLDIFGSNYDRQSDIQSRRNQLVNSLTKSIALIIEHEPRTTEHLLLTWARGGNDDAVNSNLSVAASLTLLQLMLIEPPYTTETQQWFEYHTSIQILHKWYANHREEEQRTLRTRSYDREFIRRTIGIALCYLGRYMSVAEFGSVNSVPELLKSPPSQQPHPDDLLSPWHMLIALIWDPSHLVRAGIVEGIPELIRKHREHAIQLIILLATDWNHTVRETLAIQLYLLYLDNPNNIYLVEYLFDLANEPVDRTISKQDHYLWVNYELRTRYKLDKFDLDESYREIPAHLLTATLAIFLIGNENPYIFRVYLKTRLNDNNNYRAFRAVLRWVMQNAPLQEELRNTVLQMIFLEKDEINRDNKISIDLENLMHFEAQNVKFNLTSTFDLLVNAGKSEDRSILNQYLFPEATQKRRRYRRDIPLASTVQNMGNARRNSRLLQWFLTISDNSTNTSLLDRLYRYYDNN